LLRPERKKVPSAPAVVTNLHRSEREKEVA
jgi:hypothetical protein